MGSLKKKQDKQSTPSQDNSYLKFYGVAFEVVAFNIVCIWGGIELSQRFSPNSHWILFTGILLSIAGTIYYLFKRLIKDQP